MTIVLAIGTTRSWRSAWYGVVLGVISLAVIVAVLGPALTIIPINLLRLIVGGLLLIFGLQWLRKAILRASGFKALHDEAAIYEKSKAQAKELKTNTPRGAIDDWYSFVIAFKGVFLEGLEIAFIVLTFGINQGSISLAVLSALAAILVIVIIGFKIRRPLSKVPENSLKFIVGIMLTSFGIFWGSEGAGVRWPGGDAALIGVIIWIGLTSVIQVGWLKTKNNNLKTARSWN